VNNILFGLIHSVYGMNNKLVIKKFWPPIGQQQGLFHKDTSNDVFASYKQQNAWTDICNSGVCTNLKRPVARGEWILCGCL